MVDMLFYCPDIIIVCKKSWSSPIICLFLFIAKRKCIVLFDDAGIVIIKHYILIYYLRNLNQLHYYAC